MAITAATKTTDFVSGFLPPDLAGPIFERAARNSVVMSLAPRQPLGPNGVQIPVVTGRPSVAWVGEAERKPATAGTMNLKTITPKKMAAISVVSREVARANPGNYLVWLREALAEGFAVAFDRAVLHDEGPDGTAGGGPFDTYVDQTTKSVALGTNTQADGGVYADLVDALSAVVTASDTSDRRFRLSGWALDDVMEPALLLAVDTSGRPIFTDTAVETATTIRQSRLLGRLANFGEGVATINQTDVVGYGGDFSQTAWGAIGGIEYAVSTESAVTINGQLISLWENNLLAVRAEAEYGWLVNDPEAFVKITNAANSPVTST